MPRPTNKKDLLFLSQKNYENLNTFIQFLPEEIQNREFPAGTMNRNIRDVLAHLHHWHKMVIEWYEEGMKGIKPEMPAKGYTWKDTPALNKKIWEDYTQIPLEKVKSLFEQSHFEVQSIIERHTEEELFEKRKYKWTGSTSLGAYLISCTSSHYEWALTLIKKALK